jgi:DNA-binding NtrC family response regulator
VPTLVVIVTAQQSHWDKLSGIVSSCGLQAVRCNTLAHAFELLAQRHFEFAVCDDRLPDGTFRDFITQLRRYRKSTPVVVISQFEDWHSYLQAMVAGAFDYVAFPPYPQEFERVIAGALTDATPAAPVALN